MIVWAEYLLHVLNVHFIIISVKSLFKVQTYALTHTQTENKREIIIIFLKNDMSSRTIWKERKLCEGFPHPPYSEWEADPPPTFSQL